MTAGFPYIRLPGRRRGFVRKASVWEGPDHVLVIKGTRFSEEYRRYYYQDIQALIIENRARAGSIGWWTLLIILFVAALVTAALRGPLLPGASSWPGVLLLGSFLIVRLFVALRRSCRCVIQTAVSREEVPALFRISAARKTFARLRDRIGAVQGTLPAEIPALDEQTLATVKPPEPGAAERGFSRAVEQDQKGGSKRGVNIAIAAFLILLVNSAFVLWYASASARGGRPVMLTALFFIMIESALAVMSLVLIRRGASKRFLRYMLFGALGFNFMRVYFTLAMDSVQGSGLRVVYPALRGPALAHTWSTVDGIIEFLLAVTSLMFILIKWDTLRGGETRKS